MQLKPELIKRGERHEAILMKRLGEVWMVGLFSDPYEPPKYFYFDDETEAEEAYEKMRVGGWDAAKEYEGPGNS